VKGLPRPPSKQTDRVAPRALGAPPDLQVYSFAIGGDEYAVLTFGSGDCPSLPRSPDPLTASERTVVELVLRGWSNSRIAAERGTSSRTIANQLGAAYRKLGVRSRRELVARGRGTP
jgi:DNA-binding CsgD family transcriptional regulator